jgi:lysophospholipase L1-like esterase
VPLSGCDGFAPFLSRPRNKEKLRVNLKRKAALLLAAYVVGVHAFLCLVLVKSNFVTRLERKFGFGLISTTNALPNITDFYFIMIRYHERMDGNVPDGSSVFIGDSITQGLCVDAVAVPAVNFGIGRDTTDGVLKRLPKYRCLERASAVVLAVGINDLIQEDGNDEAIGNYRRILERIPTNAAIVVSAVLPVDEGLLSPENKKITNHKITNLNESLKAICARRARCTFIDVGADLKDKTGALSSAFHIGDGVHLNNEGYAIWIKGLRDGLKAVQRNGNANL